ncbi:aryl-alcohol-oxidase from pleurotus Eryingii [Dendrothele bispora CBS 962.96]|uniref:Aryl-alcohol-oxidase from pleurotus Eryingii n=1 Tax=Dendrothele bispora (strain CBS 962.96) TaxID=1314807 RepID=A0A4V4HFZ9_DENBC|nr:aryl-alcohol-oxidase from pleurotus Eryingii [Dendrothele bispora CBS 962.96]
MKSTFQIPFTSKLLLLLFAKSSFSALLSSPRELAKSKYDFVIVGGGTAGSVIASRLTEDSSVKVLVVEAGISHVGLLNVEVPFLSTSIQPGTAIDWNYTTVAQAGLDNRTVSIPRGHVLGGSSSTNVLVWNRGSNDVWDHWSNITKDERWSWNAIEPYYLKTNHMTTPADKHNTTGQFDPSAYGSGPLDISLPGYPTELDGRVLNTSKSLGGRVKYTQDLNSGDLVGFSYIQSTIGNGERSSSATAYLEPALDRSNLDVLINTRAIRLVANETQAGTPVFTGVELVQGPQDTPIRVTASNEIVLCGGSIGTPQLLLLSGVGPKEELTTLGIDPVLDIPDVGKNLIDHPLVPTYYQVADNATTFDDLLRSADLFNQTLAQWQNDKQGLFVNSPSNTYGFLQLPDEAFVNQTNPAAGPLSANTEILFGDGFAPLGTLTQPLMGRFITILTAVVSPTSRGSITLNSSDPFEQPLINPGILTTEFDMNAMVQAVKDSQQFIHTSPYWDDFFLGPYGDLASAETDEERIELIRKEAVTIYHPVGTASMSPKEAKWGVTDPELRVKGARGLRVVDASIFPHIPECHIQALVYTVAERAADMIKEAYNYTKRCEARKEDSESAKFSYDLRALDSHFRDAST